LLDLHQCGNPLRVLGCSHLRKHFIGNDQGLHVGTNLRQQAIRPRLSRFAEKQGSKSQAATNGFLNYADTFNGTVSLVGEFPARERLPQSFQKRVMTSSYPLQTSLSSGLQIRH
jgi:hypothetical protein